MKRKFLKPIKRRKAQRKQHARRIKIRRRANRRIRITRATRSSREPKRIKLKRIRIRIRRTIPKTQRQSAFRGKALDALGRMRRLGWSLNKAAKLEHIKPQTILRHVGKALYRSGPGKPWKATRSDRLAEKMMILTNSGPIFDVVRSSIERTRLSRYNTALRKWRAAEDGAYQELLTFKGQTVAGHVLITDQDVLIRLEEGGQLDFDAFYYSLGGGQ